MKKIISFIVIKSLVSCTSFFQLSLDEELTKKITVEYLREKKPVDLNKITDFDWDNYLIITEYQTPRELSKNYNVDLSNISQNISAHMMCNTLVFIKNKKSIKICDLYYGVAIDKNKRLEIK